MKDFLQVLILLLPLIKEVLSSTQSSADTARKRRILRILRDKDASKLDRINRILKLDVSGAKIIGYSATQGGTIVNEAFVLKYEEMQKELKRGK